MGLQSMVDKALTKLVRNHEESAFLRRRFARLYGIEIGGYSYGAFDRWRIPPGTRIGRYCSFAGSALIVSANHPMDALSTHPICYLKARGLIDHDRVVAQPTIVEDDVWIGHNAIITPGCKQIGRGAVIGAGAVVTRDVPPYAIVAGNPARLIRHRFEPEVIAAIERTQWWRFDRPVLAEAARAAPDFPIRPTVDNAAAFGAALPAL